MRTDADRRSFLKSAAVVTASSLFAANAHGEGQQPPTLNAGPNPDPGKPNWSSLRQRRAIATPISLGRGRNILLSPDAASLPWKRILTSTAGC